MKRTLPTTLDGLGPETILTVPDLASIFQMSRVKVYGMLTSGKIKGYFRVGRCIRIQVKSVRAWIETENIPKENSRDQVVQRLLNYQPTKRTRKGAA